MLEKNEWNLIIENIGGIRGPLKPLKIKQPISVIMAPNAAGKSSVVRALQLFCKNPLNLSYVLNEYENSGRVELRNDEHFFVELVRVPKVGVEILPERTKLMWATDEKAFHVGFCVRDSELARIIEDYEPERLKHWFRSVSDAHYYETLISILNTLLGEKINERDRLEAILKVDVKDKEVALVRSQKELAEVEKELTAASRRLEELGYGELVKEQDRIDSDIKTLRSQIYSIEDEREKRRREERDLRDSLASLERKIDTELEELYHLTEELKVKEEAERTINMRIKEIERNLRHPDHGILPTLDRLERSLDYYQRSLHDMKSLPEAEPCVPILESRIKELKEERKLKVGERRRLEEELYGLRANLVGITRLRGRRDDKKREIAFNEKRVTEIREKELPKIEGEITEIDSKIAEKRADIEEKEAELRKLIEKVYRLEGVNKELRKRIDELSKRKSYLEKDIHYKEADLKKTLEARVEYDRAIRVVERLQGILSHMQSRYEYIIEGARNELNKALRNNFELMQFAGFDEITVTPEYELMVKRKGKPPTELPTLSSSERLTIAITMMFVAKQAYAPDFPLFVIDEVKEPYDETRFKGIINYIKGKVPYLVVTSLVPLKDKIGPEAITVSYSLPE